jgi:O-antigen/teichoic acid export membrane protein
VTMDTVYLAALVWLSGLPETAWSTAAARGLWSFSSRVMGAELVRYVSENGDKFLVARFLGAPALGFYSLAYRVLLLPVLMLEQAGRVILPTFSRLQGERERLARVVLKASESVALLICPAMTLTIVCAPVAVPALLGEAWRPAVVPLQLLAAMTVQYMLSAITGPVVLAVGRADWEFRWSLVVMAGALVAFAVGLQWGITGVATSYLVMGLALSPFRFRMMQRVIAVPASRYLRALVPAVASSIALATAWSLAALALRGATGGLPLVACASVVGLAAYVVTARSFWPDDLRDQLAFARLVVNGRVRR